MDPAPSGHGVEAFMHDHPLVIAGVGFSLIACVSSLWILLHTPSERSIPKQTAVHADLDEASVQTVVVDIQGAVVSPGLKKLKQKIGEHLIIDDVLTEAGGLLPTADAVYVAQSLNRASGVEEGMKIYIPFAGTVLGSTSSTRGSVNLNTASEDELMTLTGVGKTRAATIIKNRPYSSFAELAKKAKLSQSLIDGMKDASHF